MVGGDGSSLGWESSLVVVGVAVGGGGMGERLQAREKLVVEFHNEKVRRDQ